MKGQERILPKHVNKLEMSDACDFKKPCKRIFQKIEVESIEQDKEGGQLN